MHKGCALLMGRAGHPGRAFCLSLVLSISACLPFPMTALAKTHPIAQDEERAYTGEDGPGLSTARNTEPFDIIEIDEERLKDNLLEYDELTAMIRLYNPDLALVLTSYFDTVDKYATARSEMARYRSGAYTDKLDAKRDGNSDDYATYVQEEAIYKAGSSSYQSMYENLLGRSSTSSLRQTERQLVIVAQSLMLSYESLTLSEETLMAQLALYEKQYEIALAKQSAGLATAADVLLAQNNVELAKVSLEGIAASKGAIYDTLCLSVGRDTQSGLEIGRIAEVDKSVVQGLDLEADTKTAIGNNVTLISSRHTTGSGSSYSANKVRTIEEAETQLSIKMESLYNDVLEALADLESAEVAYEKARLERDQAEASRQAGLLSEEDSLLAELSFISSEGTYKSAGLALSEALETYNWAVIGMTDF